MAHRTMADFVAGLDDLGRSPADGGPLDLIVCRPAPGQRAIVARAELTLEDGLAGDNWRARGSRHTDDGAAEPDRQLTIMNSRAAALFAGPDRDRWALAGDQLFIDLDLSPTNLPPGTRLRLGTAVVEITAAPHTGCAKFAARYGADALRFVSVGEGQAVRARGINARVVTPGSVMTGDLATKLEVTTPAH